VLFLLYKTVAHIIGCYCIQWTVVNMVWCFLGSVLKKLINKEVLSVQWMNNRPLLQTSQDVLFSVINNHNKHQWMLHFYWGDLTHIYSDRGSQLPLSLFTNWLQCHCQLFFLHNRRPVRVWVKTWMCDEILAMFVLLYCDPTARSRPQRNWHVLCIGLGIVPKVSTYILA
jgi:hypothetical protein